MIIRNKSKVLFFLLSLIIFLIFFHRYIVQAVNVTLEDIENHNYDFTLSYANDTTAGYIHKSININGKDYNVFCREKNGTLWGTGHGVEKYYYKMNSKEKHASTKSSDPDKRKLAKLLYDCEGNTTKQQKIIWASDLNAGTDIEYTLWNNTTVGAYITPKIEVSSTNAKCKLNEDKYKIGPLTVDYQGGTNGQADLSNEIQIINAETNQKITSIDASNMNIQKNQNFYIEVSKDTLNNVKEIKIKMKVTGYYYEVTYYNFIGTGYSGDKQVIDASGQKLIAIDTERDKEEATDESDIIKLTQPRLITTKYVQRAKASEDSEWEMITTLDGEANTEEDKEYLKPKVTVKTDKDVDSKERYELRKQFYKEDGSFYCDKNFTYGSSLMYLIRVYNIGNGEADLTDTSLVSSNKTGNEGDKEDTANRKIVKDGYIWDYFDSEHLKFKENSEVNNQFGWVQDGNCYKTKLTNLKSLKLGDNLTKLPDYENSENKALGYWSAYVPIEFEIIGEDAENTMITNNGSKIPKDEQNNTKFLYSYTYKDAEGNKKLASVAPKINELAQTTDKQGNAVTLDISTKLEAPTATFDDTIPINPEEENESKRFKIEQKNSSDPTLMNEDEVTYCIRFYSIGTNKCSIGAKVIDKPGETLEYVRTIGGTAQKDGENYIITPDKTVLNGYDKNASDTYNPTTRIGVQNGISYYDVFITFKVKIELKKGEILKDTYYISNELLYNTKPSEIPSEEPLIGEENIAYGYEISGRVFIDGFENDKTTNNRDALYGELDKPVKGMKVTLLYQETGKQVCDIEKDGKKYVIDPATGELYPTQVETDENGIYTFTHLRSYELHKEYLTGKIVDGVPEMFDPPILVNSNKKEYSTKYVVKFEYNGQEYENIQYGKDNSINASYATELNNERRDFNNKFNIIDENNSEDYSLMKEETKDVLNFKAPVDENTNNRTFYINAYSGNTSNNSNESIKDSQRTVDVKTKYKEHLNLGLVKRHFNLSLTNKLENMEVSINGVNQLFTAFDGGFINADLNKDVFFQKADYNAIAANGNSPIGSDVSKELSVWVNYTITVKNESKENFIGILNQLDFYCDDRFDIMKVNGNEYNDPAGNTAGIGSFRGKIAIPVDKKELDNSADNGKIEIKISLHLSRETIKKVIDDDDVLKTLETVAEIGSYSTKYNGDIFGNGHGIGNPNAGKVDENSNAGNFDLDKYRKYIRNSSKLQEVLEFFNKEDDCRRSLGITLNKNSTQRQLTGRVFEDETKHKAETNERFGDGEYTANGKDKNIGNVTVQFVDSSGNEVKVWDSAQKIWKNLADNKTQNGTYTIEGFIPSKDYQVKFTYGNGNTDRYNAQDYKSTIDTTNQKYIPPKDDANGYSPDGAENYWYSKDSVKNKSVAKDDDTKMEKPVTLTNKTALQLEKAERLDDDDSNDIERYKNTATTARFYAPIRKEGNKGTDDETYSIGNMNLGLAERPRSELTINKVIDHINITTSDGRVLIDGSKGTANNTTWFDRYVQPIIDENLIYGSTLQVTFRYFITNTGEKDYKSTGKVKYTDNGIDITEEREYYDFGEKGTNQELVTNTPETIIDFADNGIKYNPKGLADPENDSQTLNEKYWKEAKETERAMLDEDTQNYYDDASIKLTTTNDVDFRALEPGETYGVEDDEKLYLTLSKVLSTRTDDKNNELKYINTTEILKQTNSVGRRSYHTTTKPGRGQDSQSNYTTKPKRQDPNNENSRIIGYEVSDATSRGNGENVLLSDVENRLEDNETNINKEIECENYLVLTIPGDIGNPKNEAQTTLYWEPDADEGSIVIVPPFGSQKIIWISIGTILSIILAGGIYLIKKKVL